MFLQTEAIQNQVKCDPIQVTQFGMRITENDAVIQQIDHEKLWESLKNGEISH